MRREALSSLKPAKPRCPRLVGRPGLLSAGGVTRSGDVSSQVPGRPHFRGSALIEWERVVVPKEGIEVRERGSQSGEMGIMPSR